MSFMTTIRNYCILFCINLVKFCSRLPKHVAFIMDGNRRYSRKVGADLKTGYSKGCDKLMEHIKWCHYIGIRELTFYAFSIENFKRSEDEVAGLFDLLREKLNSFIIEIDQFNNMGVRIRILGRWSMLGDDVKALASRLTLATRNNNKLILNIAFCYTGRDEICRAASKILDGVKNKELVPEDIDADLITHTLEISEPDLLIRTSGEVRLSDFMVWQLSRTVLYFTEVLWPETTVWDLLAAIIHFQLYASTLTKKPTINNKKQIFLDGLKREKWQELEKFASCLN